MSWACVPHEHLDGDALPPLCPQVTYGSFDYTSLLYLSDYLDDFGGGRFVFVEEGANKTVEPRAGRALTRQPQAWAGAQRCCACLDASAGPGHPGAPSPTVAAAMAQRFPEPAPPCPVVHSPEGLSSSREVILPA